MVECDECSREFKRGEKVAAACQGRRITQRKALEIRFWCKDCAEKLFGNAGTLMTVTQWREKFRKEYTL